MDAKLVTYTVTVHLLSWRLMLTLLRETPAGKLDLCLCMILSCSKHCWRHGWPVEEHFLGNGCMRLWVPRLLLQLVGCSSGLIRPWSGGVQLLLLHRYQLQILAPWLEEPCSGCSDCMEGSGCLGAAAGTDVVLSQVLEGCCMVALAWVLSSIGSSLLLLCFC